MILLRGIKLDLLHTDATKNKKLIIMKLLFMLLSGRPFVLSLGLLHMPIGQSNILMFKLFFLMGSWKKKCICISLKDLSCLAVNLMFANFEEHYMACIRARGLGTLGLMRLYYRMNLPKAWQIQTYIIKNVDQISMYSRCTWMICF